MPRESYLELLPAATAESAAAQAWQPGQEIDIKHWLQARLAQTEA